MDLIARVPIAEGLFTLSNKPTLLGGRCLSCDAVTFPMKVGCPRCGATAMNEIELGDRGTLYSWTSQGFPPKAPFRGEFGTKEGFTPWLVGLVEIPGMLRVEALLSDISADTVAIGMPLRLVLVPFRTDAETGIEIVTFAFAADFSESTHA